MIKWVLGPTQMLLVETTFVGDAMCWVFVKLCAPWNVNQKQKGRKRVKGRVIPTLVAIASHENLLRTLSGSWRCKVIRITIWEQQSNGMRTAAWEKHGKDPAPGALENIAKAARVRGHSSERQVWSCRSEALSNIGGMDAPAQDMLLVLAVPFCQSHSLTLSW